MPTKSSPAKRARKSTTKKPSVTYDEFKEFEGQRYTGMKVGRSHKWYYDEGEWREKKITPDLWQIAFDVTKRRAGRAPEGSGVPVGTEYHWYILADQTATKQDANSYTTEMVGLKYKLAHKRADKPSWSASDRAQRKRLIQLLEEMITALKKKDAAPAPVTRLHRRRAATPKRKHLAAA